ncbi:hypothetical protein KC19_8G081400 [Ceratodon purpureus]|nr:hypothetical protein KC19_8G081400 [Ceratodon purpureus]KAG0564083.1 hypothetical protein KC19_8G081400 [Ceratodon purpureus]KAG0564084.1 hypothetical protein KC19_8G081400 [Ceratodon purpureus]
MPPRKKLKPSANAKVEDYFAKPGVKEEEQSPKARARKPKPSASVKEEDERTEARVGKLGDKTVEAGPSDIEGRPPLSQGVHPGRIQNLKPGENKDGPVVYWMSRDHRSRDNWALLHAVHQAREKGVAVAVAFNLVESFLEARARHFGFMLRGLRVVEQNLKAVDIPFFLFRGKAEETIPAFVKKCNASLLVMDYSSLRIGKQWRKGICENVPPSVAVAEVDAHNVVPIWCASDKMEYGARTIRNKITKQLPDFLNEYPILENSGKSWKFGEPDAIDWDSLIADVTRIGAEVPEVTWCEAGEDAALEALSGKAKGFVNMRIKNYENRNDPSKPTGLSGLSPYLHYGHISAQRCALEARKFRKVHTKSVDAFLEELIVRGGLAENYCHYQPNYDNLKGAWGWAQESLRIHAKDKREWVYTEKELEEGKTHDKLWNAAQLEMVYYGKMHGFMRMYWAKKILEWTESPEEALRIAIYLNDKYELDGRDPNGYVGCMWSICGIHDQGWKERPVFGKIRYMNYNGCKRKFNIDGYVMNVNQMVAKTKQQLKEGTAGTTSSKPMAQGKSAPKM